MTTRILTAALVLALIRASGADAEEPGRGMSISAPPLGAVTPAVTIQVTQTPAPSAPASPGVLSEPGSEPLLTLDEAVAIALKDNRGVRMATLGHWKDGVMDEEYLFWDNQTFMKQIGLAK